MPAKIYELSVFFPAYNEEGNIQQTVLDAKKVLVDVAEEWEIIVIDDGSSDQTKAIVEKLGKEDSRIKVISHKKNQGYGGALKTGYKSSKYPWVAFTDSDGQFDFAEISKFLKLTSKADLILGYRLKRADSVLRKLYTVVWSRVLPRVLLGLKVRDYSCGFKLIKKKVFDSVQPLVGEEKVTQIEMLTKAQRQGFTFSEVGVNHYPRAAGTQTGASLKVVFKSVADLITLWKKVRTYGNK